MGRNLGVPSFGLQTPGWRHLKPYTEADKLGSAQVFLTGRLDGSLLHLQTTSFRHLQLEFRKLSEPLPIGFKSFTVK